MGPDHKKNPLELPAISNPAFQTLKTTLTLAYNKEDPAYSWIEFLDDCQAIVSLNSSIDDYYLTLKPTHHPPTNSIYSMSSRGVPTFAFNPQKDCTRCGRSNHELSACFARHCANCRAPLNRGTPHDSRSCNPDLRQEVFGLGITPGSKGSTPFTAPFAHTAPPRPPYHRPSPTPRGPGQRYTNNVLLRGPRAPTPQAQHAAHLAHSDASSSNNTTPPSASVEHPWTDDHTSQYDTFTRTYSPSTTCSTSRRLQCFLLLQHFLLNILSLLEMLQRS